MTWPNDYSLNSPGIDSWLKQNEWNLFENKALQSPSLASDQYIAPNNLYNSSTSTPSHNHHASSEASSPEALSLCDDDLTLISPKKALLSAPSPTNAIPTAPRKRGRPRTTRTGGNSPHEEPPQISKLSNKPSKRQPHNQIERKYREGLNAELERLRMTLPTIHKWEIASSCSGGSGMPKTSKAAVLAGAVAYIRDLEREREFLRRENEVLRSGRGSSRK